MATISDNDQGGDNYSTIYFQFKYSPSLFQSQDNSSHVSVQNDQLQSEIQTNLATWLVGWTDKLKQEKGKMIRFVAIVDTVDNCVASFPLTDSAGPPDTQGQQHPVMVISIKGFFGNDDYQLSTEELGDVYMDLQRKLTTTYSDQNLKATNILIDRIECITHEEKTLQDMLMQKNPPGTLRDELRRAYQKIYLLENELDQRKQKSLETNQKKRIKRKESKKLLSTYDHVECADDDTPPNTKTTD